ncbi:MAG: DUF4347 domain-containing protein, partial [Nostocales cyanobacterium]
MQLTNNFDNYKSSFNYSLPEVIVFIDSGLTDYQYLLKGVKENAIVYLLDNHKNAIDQITIYLENFVNEGGVIKEIHIVSHGSPGCLYLGTTVLNSQSLAQYIPKLQQWRELLIEGANILLYSCNVAAKHGQEFIKKLAEITGANIAASTKFIGNLAEISNWELDFQTGEITAKLPFSSKSLRKYQGILATITVTNTNDSGAGSLRQAIANAQPGDTITFASNLANQTITLTSGELTVNKDLIIDGSTATNLTISGNNASRVFAVRTNAISQPSNVVFKNITIANGRANGTDESGAGGGIRTFDASTILVENCQLNNNYAGYGGGAIFSGFRCNTTIVNSKFDNNIGAGVNTERGGGAIATKNAGSLTIRGSEFTNNKGTTGGAINNLLQTLIIEDSIFRNNDTLAGASIVPSPGAGWGYGGAIFSDGANASGPNFDYGMIGGNITIRNSLFDGNIGAGQGGALFLYGYYNDQITIENSTIANNQVVENGRGDAFGGGIRIGTDLRRYEDQPAPTNGFIIKNSAIYNNSSLKEGGGLWLGEDSKGSIINTIFSGNKADDGNGNGFGGAITFENRGNPVNITNTTIAYNHAGFQGGAFWKGGSNITLKNTLVGYSTAGNIWGVKINTGIEFSDGGGNLQWPPKHPTDASDMNITNSPNLIIADPLLDPTLRDNGGGILTHALLTGSPAINTGTTTTLTTDARGFTRDINPDIGAFEFINVIPISGIRITQSGGNTNVVEGGVTDSYTLVLNSQPTANVTVNLNSGSQLATNVNQLIFTPQNWNVAQNVTVTAVNDSLVEGNHNGSIQHTVTSTDTAYNNLVIPAVNVGISDNDTGGITITQSGGNTNVVEGGAT